MTRAEFLCLTKGTAVKVGDKTGVVGRTDKEKDMDVFVSFADGSEDWIYFTDVQLTRIQPDAPVRPAQALQAINNYRDRRAQPKLDPYGARWGPDDLLTEYARLVKEGHIKLPRH
jgi:hypothetical protein